MKRSFILAVWLISVNFRKLRTRAGNAYVFSSDNFTLCEVLWVSCNVWHQHGVIDMYYISVDWNAHQKSSLVFNARQQSNYNEEKNIFVCVTLCFSMKHVTWVTWLWWRCWSQREPYWTHLAMKMTLLFTTLWEMDIQQLWKCYCSLVLHRVYCKLLQMFFSYLVLEERCCCCHPFLYMPHCGHCWFMWTFH